MFKKAHLQNAIPVVMEKTGGVRSVCLGIWVKVGSRNEPPGKNGISHFLEHMFFKGTGKRTAEGIAVEVDSMGGDFNAFTSKETTTFYIKVLDEYLDKAVELITDVFVHSAFPEEEVEKEKGVIKEEIKSVEDTPDDYVHDLFSRDIWGEAGLGQPVLGRRDTVKSFTKEDIMAYVSRYYGAGNIVVSCAGSFEPVGLLDALNRHMGRLKGGEATGAGGPPAFRSGLNLHEREHSEVHLCLGVQGIPQASPDRYSVAILNTILGAGISSRLFQEIREKRGLAYTIHSFLVGYLDTGLWGVYAGTGRKRLGEVAGLVMDELRRLPGSITPAELERAKKQLKGNLILSLESTSSRMQNIARQEMYYGRYFGTEDVIRAVEAVSLDDLSVLSERLLRGKTAALTVLGPVEKTALKTVDLSL